MRKRDKDVFYAPSGIIAYSIDPKIFLKKTALKLI